MKGGPARIAAVALAAAVLTLAPGQGRAQAPAATDTAMVPFRLGDPAPSPFQEEVRISFRLGAPAVEDRRAAGRVPPDSVRVSVAVYNVLYQRVAWARTAEARDGGVPVRDRRYAVPGSYEVVWRGRARGGRRVPSGPYFVELVVNGRTAVRKVLLTR